MIRTFQSVPNVLGSHPGDIHGQRKSSSLVYRHDLPTAPEDAGKVWMRDWQDHNTNVEPYLFRRQQQYTRFQEDLRNSKSALKGQTWRAYKDEAEMEKFLGANGVPNVLRSPMVARRLKTLRGEVERAPNRREKLRSHHKTGFGWQLRAPLQNDRSNNWPAYQVMDGPLSEASVRQNLSEARLYDSLVAKQAYPTQAGSRSTTESVYRFTQQTGEKFAQALAKRRLPIKAVSTQEDKTSVSAGDLAKHGKEVENLIEAQAALQEKASALTETQHLEAPRPSGLKPSEAPRPPLF